MAKKGVESCFIDTNILVYASDVNSPWYEGLQSDNFCQKGGMA